MSGSSSSSDSEESPENKAHNEESPKDEFEDKESPRDQFLEEESPRERFHDEDSPKDKFHTKFSRQKIHGDHKNEGKGRHLFGRQSPMHSALGGGKSADVILWRNKQMSSAALVSATIIWLLFQMIDYHLIPFICHFFILSLAFSLLWSNLSCYVRKSKKFRFPEITLPENLCNKFALLLRDHCNKAIHNLREIAVGRDVKKFLQVLFGLWILSILGSWFDFLTIVYVVFVMVLSVPLIYEKHEDRVDTYAQKAKSKLLKQYNSFDEKVLKKLPKVPFIKENKQDTAGVN